MDSFTLYKDRIGMTLTTRLADAMEKEVVTIEESQQIAQAILDGVNGAKDPGELMSFMEELAHEWTLFGPVLVAEQSGQIGEVIEKQEDQAISEVENLLKENRLDEAIATAEHATQESATEAASIELPQDPTFSPPPSPDVAQNPPTEAPLPETPPVQQNVDQNPTWEESAPKDPTLPPDFSQEQPVVESPIPETPVSSTPSPDVVPTETPTETPIDQTNMMGGSN